MMISISIGVKVEIEGFGRHWALGAWSGWDGILGRIEPNPVTLLFLLYRRNCKPQPPPPLPLHKQRKNECTYVHTYIYIYIDMYT